MRKKIIRALIKLGVPANLNGFRYCCDAIEIIGKNPRIKLRDVYAEVGERNGTTPGAVERCLRYTVQIMIQNEHELLPDNGDNRVSNVLYTIYFKIKEGICTV